MKRPMILMLVTVAIFFGALFGWKAFVGMQMQKQMQAMAMPAVTVSSAQVTSATWAPAINAVGSLRALQGVDVTPQVAGQVVELHFDSGDTVKARDLLVQQYTADEQAQLAGLVADRQLAEQNLERSQNLIKEDLTSEFDLDSRRTDVQRTRAAETDLRLKIEKKSIRAPFSGQLGIRKVDLGQYLQPGDTIARLEAREQMLVDFPVPQREFANLQLGQSIYVLVDAWPGRRFSGVIRAIEPQVERATRNIRVRAVVENAAHELVPGMFAQVEIQLATQQQVITVPQSAITYSPYGDSVYLVEDFVNDEGQTLQRVVNAFVVTGATRGDQVAVLSGLEAGATIVGSGQQKLRNGATVVINNSVEVRNDPAPVPSNN